MRHNISAIQDRLLKYEKKAKHETAEYNECGHILSSEALALPFALYYVMRSIDAVILMGSA